MQDLPEDEPAELEACSSSENFDFVVSSQSSHYRRWQPLGTSMSRRIRMRKQSLACLGSLPHSVPALALSYAGLCHSFWDQGQEALKSLQGMCVVLDDEVHQKAGLLVQLGVVTCHVKQDPSSPHALQPSQPSHHKDLVMNCFINCLGSCW